MRRLLSAAWLKLTMFCSLAAGGGPSADARQLFPREHVHDARAADARSHHHHAGACHLEAPMIERAIADWDLDDIDLLLIENVGNLVCPASYDLGEAAKIVLLSCAEGDDKPLKYPAIFFKAELLVLTKTDLLPYVRFDINAAEQNAHRQRKGLEVVRVSALSREGIAPWLEWLNRKRNAVRPTAGAVA